MGDSNRFASRIESIRGTESKLLSFDSTSRENGVKIGREMAEIRPKTAEKSADLQQVFDYGH